jgi:hypothetical protein
MLKRTNAKTNGATTNDATTNDATTNKRYNEQMLQRMNATTKSFYQ